MDEVQRDIGRIEGTLAAHGVRLDSLETKIDAHNQVHTEKLDRILAYQERQKGGMRVVVMVGSAVAALFGAAASLLIDTLKGHTPQP